MTSSSPFAYLENADRWSRRWRYHGDVRLPFRPGAHTHGEIALVEGGEATYVIGRRVLTVGAGQIAWVPPGVEHATIFGPRICASAIDLPRECIPDELSGEAGVCAEAPGLIALVALLADPTRRQSAHGRFEAEAARDAIAARITFALRRPRGATPTPELAPHTLRRIVDRIHAELDTPWTIQMLADMAGLSRFHFSRAFRRATGQSPYQFVLTTRLEAAAALLPIAAMSIAEVALVCGFMDQSRFTQMFKRRWGKTPNAFRRNLSAARVVSGPRRPRCA